ncbi:MAG: hypothetical protein ACREPX_03880 [Rhodanobacteraceae bacterium]
MKTTIDIADDLISRAKQVQKRDGVTLRALVEDGLRLVLDRDARKPKYRFVPVVAGTAYQGGPATIDVNALIAEANERDWVEREDSLRVAEPRATYASGAKKPGARKKTAKRKR